MSLNLSNTIKGGTMALNAAGIAKGTTDATIKIAATDPAGVHYMIDGLAYYKANTDNIAITAAAQQAASTTCLYLVCIDSAGAVTTVKGTEVATADLTAGTAVLKWPTPTSGTCPIGAFKIATDSTHTYTAGTTDNSATGITATYYDLAIVPSAPLTS